MPTIDDLYRELEEKQRAAGVTIEPTYRQDLERTYQGGTGTTSGARSPEDVFKDLSAQIERRKAPTSDRTQDSQGGNYNNDGSLTAQGRANAQASGTNPTGYASGTDSPLYKMLQEFSRTQSSASSGPFPATPTATSTAADATRQPTVGLDSTEAVKQLYQWFLGREPDEEGLAGFLANAPKGQSASLASSPWYRGVLNTFMQSPEYQQRAPSEVTKLYQQYLGRTPTDDEIRAHAGNPQGLAGAAYVIANSDEARARSAQTTTAPPPAVPSAPGPAAPPPSTPTPTPTAGPFPSGTFSDSASNFAEGYARDRFAQRTNPPAGSGTALYEGFAKELANLLQGDVFTDTEEAAMRAKTFDQLEQDRRQEQQEVAEEMGRRRIPPTSGIYMSRMDDVNRRYERIRASRENELLVYGIGERQRRLTQSFSVLASLAASEEGRLDAALALSMIPLQLQDQAFNRLVTASGMGGNLSGVTGDLMQLLTMATNQRLYNDQQRAGAWNALGQYIGQYFL